MDANGFERMGNQGDKFVARNERLAKLKEKASELAKRIDDSSVTRAENLAAEEEAKKGIEKKATALVKLYTTKEGRDVYGTIITTKTPDSGDDLESYVITFVFGQTVRDERHSQVSRDIDDNDVFINPDSKSVIHEGEIVPHANGIAEFEISKLIDSRFDSLRYFELALDARDAEVSEDASDEAHTS